MPHLKSLPSDAVLRDVFHAFPATARPLLEYHEALLRGPSPLSVAERELIAAYVSGLNACGYCAGAHTATAAAFGVESSLLDALRLDVDSSPVAPRLKPLLRYVAKLTRTPARLTEADAAAVFAAGWDDRALHDAVSVCGLFNLMNRLVEGLGIAGRPEYFQIAGERLHREGYAALANGLPTPIGTNAGHVPPITT
ncbi:MAG: peroxidase-related enzyme [Limisphaerales bacterium]